MQKVLFSFKKEIIGKLLRGVINKQETTRLLGCSPRTVRNYLAKTAVGGFVVF
ncbi:helix-turn-helix domain-containing protein [Candidatus Gottesmanbacteria bacterium]|nr:helix-turn-helix domain-containing protein [Candidatus Gottesmanbacteria bacterium]